MTPNVLLTVMVCAVLSYGYAAMIGWTWRCFRPDIPDEADNGLLGCMSAIWPITWALWILWHILVRHLWRLIRITSGVQKRSES